MGGRGNRSGLSSKQANTLLTAPTDTTPQPTATRNERPEPEQPLQMTRADVARLQQIMGQTGYEAGDPDASPQNKLYVKTSKSFNINAFLRSDGATVHDPSGNSQWEYLGYTKADAARAVRQIDAGMKPLPVDVALTRFVGGSALGAILGNPRITSANIGRIIQSVKTPQGAAKFAAALNAADYTEKGYTSTTYLQTHPSFDTRQLRLNIVAKKGTNAIVTNNHAENEVLLGRAVKYKFTGGFRVITTPKGVEQLVLDVEI